MTSSMPPHRTTQPYHLRRPITFTFGIMYRVVLACSGVPKHVGAAAAVDITEEFTHRPWQEKARCTWDGLVLRLQADNDFDENGAALIDEFSDAIATCIADGFDGSITVESVTVLPGAD